MAYLLKRTGQGGGYVAPPGSPKAYVHRIENARQFPTRDAAEHERCPQNEIIVSVPS